MFPSNTQEITLPISGKKVVLTVPTWGQQKNINLEARTLKLSPEDQSVLSLVRTCTFDGERLMKVDALDNYDMRDVNALSKAFMALLGEQDEKNE